MQIDLKAGDLAAVPFPRLIWQYGVEKSSGILELTRSNVTKKLFFDAGELVHAESNLLHETLVKHLCEEGKINQDQEQSILAQSVESQKPVNEILLENKIIDAAQLYEALRKVLAMKILNCFGWQEGSYTFTEDSTFMEKITPMRMNLGRLLLQGIDRLLPAESIRKDGTFDTKQTFKVATKSPLNVKELQLATDEVRFLKNLKKEVTVDELTKAAECTEEEVLRKLYAFAILGIVTQSGGSTDEGITLDQLVEASLLQGLQPVQPAPSVDEADAETRALANEIATDHMRLMDLNYFEILSAPESATAVQIRDKFIEFSEKYGPSRFKKESLSEFRPQAEEIFLRGVRAFGTLSEYDSKTKYLDKIKAERAGKKTPKKKAGEAFKIQTKLLDAKPQFQKGLKCLKEKKYQKAMEYFDYARDIDNGNPEYIAYLGWTKYQDSPERNQKEAEEFLNQAIRMKTKSESAAFLMGKFLVATGQPKKAIPHLKKAVELSPKNLEMVRELRNIERSTR